MAEQGHVRRAPPVFPYPFNTFLQVCQFIRQYLAHGCGTLLPAIMSWYNGSRCIFKSWCMDRTSASNSTRASSSWQNTTTYGCPEFTSRLPLPVHVSARHEDLVSLVNGLIRFDQGAAGTIDPVIAAAVLAFGFVYIHPLEDGSGRIHHYLIHHALDQRDFNPPGVIFPISSAIPDGIDRYRTVLESYSERLLPLDRKNLVPCTAH